MSERKSDDDGAAKFGYIPGRRRRQTTLLETARIQGIFRSAAAKLEWANRHIAELERQSSDYLKAHWRFRLRTGAPLRELVLEFDAPYRVPLRFGLMVGDAANNLRSTLDHIVWKVVSPHVPEKQHRNVQYPFAGKGDICDAIKKGLVGEAGDTAVKIVEHHASRIEGRDRLNNDDKHRLIPTLSQVADIRGFLRGRPPPNDYVATNGVQMGPDHLRSLGVSGFPIKADRNGAVDVSKIDMTIQLIFGADGPFSGQPVVPTLNCLAENSERSLRTSAKHSRACLAASTRTYSKFHGTRDWIADTSMHWRASRIDNSSSGTRSPNDHFNRLDGAHAMVPHGSIAAVESIILGCPVFVHPDSAAALLTPVFSKSRAPKS
jgi:hypothetical protein